MAADSELWAGVNFKVGEARFFLERMGNTLADARQLQRNPQYHQGYTAGRWQPDFFYYFDAFLGAAHSVPDVVQKCFGWDSHSEPDWPTAISSDEKLRRKQFQHAYQDDLKAFRRLPLSCIRCATFHWSGIPSVRTAASSFGAFREFTGSPTDQIPSSAVRQFPDDMDSNLVALFSKPHAVEPEWEKFKLLIPQDGGAVKELPFFEHCKEYLDGSVGDLLAKAREICERIHKDSPLTPPPLAKIPRQPRP